MNEKIEEKVEICPFDFVQVFIAVTIKERDNFDENKTEPFYPLSVYWTPLIGQFSKKNTSQTIMFIISREIDYPVNIGC